MGLILRLCFGDWNLMHPKLDRFAVGEEDFGNGNKSASKPCFKLADCRDIVEIP